MTERDIQRELYWSRRGGCSLIVPNYTPWSWFECDIFAVTKIGYFHEYEIKLTISDFKADRHKTRARGHWENGRWLRHPVQTKHARLASADIRGPSRFTYVVPEGMVVLDPPERIDPTACLPDWAGLIYVVPIMSDGYPVRYRLSSVRTGPRLHREKVTPRTVEHARRVCYYRMWSERMTTDELRRQSTSVVQEAAGVPD